MISKMVQIKSLIGTNKKIRGSFVPPSDKSITHRAVFLAALSTQKSVIKNPLLSGDCLSTVNCFKRIGVPIQVSKNEIKISAGKRSHCYPYRQLKRSKLDLDCGNSGTTMRLISGVLSAQPFESRLVGDESLSKRPMKRVIEPLTQMGARINARDGNYAPLIIKGTLNLKPVSWKSSIASAQVKTSILLAGLFVRRKTTVIEPTKSRDHTERMLKGLGAKIQFDPNSSPNKKNKVSIFGNHPLKGLNIVVPGDFSSAAFFIAATLIVPGSKLIIKNVNLNPTRSGLLNVLKRMGAKIRIKNLKNVCHEPVGNLEIQYSRLKGVSISANEIPLMIDEVPILSVIATQAEGKTEISGAEELRVKESDRLTAIVSELSKMGAKIKEKKDGLMIEGIANLVGTKVESYSDHRMAMSLAIAALNAKGTTTIQHFDSVKISFPNFLNELNSLIRR